MRTRAPKSVFQHLRFILFVSFAIPILITSLGFSYYIHISNEFNYRTLSRLLTSASLRIGESTEALEKMADSILGDRDIQEELERVKDATDQPRIDGYTILKNRIDEYYSLYSKESIDSIRLITSRYELTQSSLYSKDLPASIRADLIQRAQNARGAIVWVSDYAPQNGIFLIRELRRISYLKLDPIGYLIVSIDPQQLISRSVNEKEFPQAAFALCDQGRWISSSKHFPFQPQELLTSPAAYQLREQNHVRFFITHSGVSNVNWSFYCALNYQTLYQDIIRLRNGIVFIICLSALVAFLLLKRLTKPISRDFLDLTKRIDTFGSNRELTLSQTPANASQTMEFNQIHVNIDRMATRIQTLVKENYAAALQAKEAQLKVLENQIHPHFLFNTLESIHWRGEMLGDEIISTMTSSLGELLRISLSSDPKNSNIQGELALVQSYLTIQQYRYDDLNFQFELEDGLENIFIPKFTLQPLVENAIRYSLDTDSDSCTIQLSIKSKGNSVCIILQNTGSTFPENLIDRLENESLRANGFGIGILHVKRHLELEYGNKYSLRTYNDSPYACIEICIPKERSE